MDIETQFHYDLHRAYTDIKSNYSFNESCQETVPESIIAFLESKDYEDAIRLTVSMGGDSDTMGAITGAIASAFYNCVSNDIVSSTLRLLPPDLRKVYDNFNQLYPISVITQTERK